MHRMCNFLAVQFLNPLDKFSVPTGPHFIAICSLGLDSGQEQAGQKWFGNGQGTRAGAGQRGEKADLN